MRSLILSTVFIFIILSAKAQNINGNIINQKQQAIAGATVSLLLAKDSSLLQTAISNSTGDFNFIYVDSVPLLVSVSHIGYTEQIVKIQQQKNIIITIAQNPVSLAQVVVIAKKPMIEVKLDKVVFNVENSINAIGNTGFDLLRKSPGVVIDNNDNISLSGNAVAIYIDGKPTPLSGKELEIGRAHV